MKQLDRLILSAFIGPFILTFLVVVFILLTQHMLKYFDDIIGKDIGFTVLANLMFDFSIFMTPVAIPLAVLLSSLMTFGNLGEHFELTAVKSTGISLLRTLRPIFIFVIGLTILAFYSNNYFVPKAALNAYSLLYDIKQKKPALDLKEGAFYNGIPDLSIKVERKDPESGKIWDVIIYDHRDKNGNKKVTLADSGRMYMVLKDQYLILELYSGHNYIEGQANANTAASGSAQVKAESLSRIQFDKSKIVLDLSSFDLKRTEKELFSGNKIMRNLSQLRDDLDSLRRDVLEHKLTVFKTTRSRFKYLSIDRIPLSKELTDLEILKDSLLKIKEEGFREEFIDLDTVSPAEIDANNNENKINEPVLRIVQAVQKTHGQKVILPQSVKKKKEVKDESTEELNIFMRNKKRNKQVLKTTIGRVRQIKSEIQNTSVRIENSDLERHVFEVQWHKIVSNSFACLVMFLIGAPLGAIIKKGGLGIPVLISIFFFIVFYVLGMIGEKQAKQGLIDPLLGVWAANIVLLPIGLFFLRQARNDARLFDADFYNVALDKIKTKFTKKG